MSKADPLWCHHCGRMLGERNAYYRWCENSKACEARQLRIPAGTPVRYFSPLLHPHEGGYGTLVRTERTKIGVQWVVKKADGGICYLFAGAVWGVQLRRPLRRKQKRTVPA